jgi:UDP-N-acetylmuramate dehydrogenase
VLIQEHIPLAPMTTFGIGGPARYFVEATSADDLREAIAFARERDLPIFVLGGGSNLLVADEGFHGVVIKVALHGVEIRPQQTADSSRHTRALGMTLSRIEKRGEPCAIVTAAAGEDWDALVAYSVERGLGGFECMSGIPGTVGATPVQNVGAYGQEVSSTIIEVEALDITTCELRTFSSAECAFSYRTSLFNTTVRERYIITRVRFELRPGATPNIGYRDLKQHFGDRTPTLAETREAVLAIRRSKGMLIQAQQAHQKHFLEDPHLPNAGRYGASTIGGASTICGIQADKCDAAASEEQACDTRTHLTDDADCSSAGSFFKNPVLTEIEFAEFEHRAAERGVTAPNYPALSSQHKVPAAWLVEQAGFPKGFADGPVGISSKHALAIVNRGGAHASDVLRLKDRIQRAVSEQFGIHLQPEPVFLGFETPSSASAMLAGEPAR